MIRFWNENKKFISKVSIPKVIFLKSYNEYNAILVQDCGNSSAYALELPQSCAKP